MSRRFVSFHLLCEGSSDHGLVPHLSTLLVQNGATEAIGTAGHQKGSLVARLARIRDELPGLHLVFVHCDADSPKSASRRDEISVAAQDVGLHFPCVPVVPVQEMEAWLLVDESAIRSAAGRPAGRVRLTLPKLREIERTANPKDVLSAALAEASEKTGRKLTQERRQFGDRRRILLERLDPNGRVRQLDSWRQLEQDIRGACIQLGYNTQ